MTTAKRQHISLIDGLEDLRPGDIMLGPIGGLVPGLFPVAAGQAVLGELFRVGGLSVRHAGVVVEAGGSAPPRLVEAMPTGARLVSMTRADHWAPRHAYVRLPEDHLGQADDAAAIARAMVGTPYSFASYAALAAWRLGWRSQPLERWINRRQPKTIVMPDGRRVRDVIAVPGAAGWNLNVRLPCEAICSVLVDQAWTLAGKQVMPHGTRPQIVTPGALASQLLRTPHTMWGFPNGEEITP